MHTGKNFHEQNETSESPRKQKNNQYSIFFRNVFYKFYLHKLTAINAPQVLFGWICHRGCWCSTVLSSAWAVVWFDGTTTQPFGWSKYKPTLGCVSKIFFYIHPIWRRFPIWLYFFGLSSWNRQLVQVSNDMTVVLKEKRWDEEWLSIPFHLNISTRIFGFWCLHSRRFHRGVVICQYTL